MPLELANGSPLHVFPSVVPSVVLSVWRKCGSGHFSSRPSHRWHESALRRDASPGSTGRDEQILGAGMVRGMESDDGAVLHRLGRLVGQRRGHRASYISGNLDPYDRDSL